jgi:hypothetical protein
MFPSQNCYYTQFVNYYTYKNTITTIILTNKQKKKQNKTKPKKNKTKQYNNNKKYFVNHYVIPQTKIISHATKIEHAIISTRFISVIRHHGRTLSSFQGKGLIPSWIEVMNSIRIRIVHQDYFRSKKKKTREKKIQQIKQKTKNKKKKK